MYDLFTIVYLLTVIQFFYKFIHTTVVRYIHTYTKLRTCTTNKHTYQGQYINIYTNIDLNYITLRHKMQHINKARHMTNHKQSMRSYEILNSKHIIN